MSKKQIEHELHQLESQDRQAQLSKEEQESAGKALLAQLGYVSDLLWDRYSEEEILKAREHASAYKTFLDQAKTEREFVKKAVEKLEQSGFVALDSLKDGDLKPGKRVYQIQRHKALCAAVIGQEDLEKGFHIVGAHIDSPRVDLKPHPLYEDQELAYFKTHYYGGIKKYQWTTRPLALHGVVTRADGTQVSLAVGESEDDPIFAFTELLIHLSREQMQKKATEVVTGEELNLLVGSEPYPEKIERRFCLGLLKYLYERYGITERDLITAELEIVPAGKARDLGFDRSMIAAYGHDDRICSWTGLEALTQLSDTPRQTAVLILTDKEEVGSQGNTGAQSRVFETFLLELLAMSQDGSHNERQFRRAIEASAMLSADVTNGIDPTFPSVSDRYNDARLGHGIAILKATGSGGKGGANDASSEFMTWVGRVFDQAEVAWQAAELGRVDAGGGGTVAKYFSNLGMDVIDCGVPLLCMHAPQEIAHVLDLHETIRAYEAFYKA